MSLALQLGGCLGLQWRHLWTLHLDLHWMWKSANCAKLWSDWQLSVAPPSFVLNVNSCDMQQDQEGKAGQCSISWTVFNFKPKRKKIHSRMETCRIGLSGKTHWSAILTRTTKRRANGQNLTLFHRTSMQVFLSSKTVYPLSTKMLEERRRMRRYSRMCQQVRKDIDSFFEKRVMVLVSNDNTRFWEGWRKGFTRHSLSSLSLPHCHTHPH